VSTTVIALDIVSYSLELDQVQERMVRILSDVIADSLATSGLSPSILPTGDGALIVLEDGRASEALTLAISIRRAIDKRLLRLPLRIGIHSGQSLIVVDAAGESNYVGSTLNIGQRIMDLGEEGHILLSRRIADELHNDEVHGRHIHRLSVNPVVVKHGVELEIYNYFDGQHGLVKEPDRAQPQSEVILAQVGRRADWEEPFRPSSIVRVVDLSLPMIGIPALIEHLESKHPLKNQRFNLSQTTFGTAARFGDRFG
jgi:Adenylate and Guanylate cyclase catalytic domain